MKKNSLGTKLCQLRRLKNLSQQEVADRVGVCQSAYCAWESDKSMPNIKYFQALSLVLDIDISYVIEDDYNGDADIKISEESKIHTFIMNLNKKSNMSYLSVISLQQKLIENLEVEIKLLKQIIDKV